MNPLLSQQQVFNKDAKRTQWKKHRFFHEMCSEKKIDRCPQGEEGNETLLLTIQKNQPKIDNGLKHQIMKHTRTKHKKKDFGNWSRQ